jgi:hypothetical protein
MEHVEAVLQTADQIAVTIVSDITCKDAHFL